VLATWNKREGDLIAANKLDRIVAQVRQIFSTLNFSGFGRFLDTIQASTTPESWSQLQWNVVLVSKFYYIRQY